MSMIRSKALSGALLVGLTVIGAASCDGKTESPREENGPAREVRVATAAVQPLARTFEAGGVITARTTAQLSPRVTAELRAVSVRPGDHVKRGQIVAVLDGRDLIAAREQAQASVSAAKAGAASAEAQRESAQAGLTLARASHQRIEQLRERNSATPQELDRATAELKLAETAVGAAHARVAEASASVSAAQAASRAADAAASFSTIAAPFDGLVTNRLLEPGNMALSGVPLLTLETADGFRLEVQIDAARAGLVALGDSATVELPGSDEANTATGRIVEVARAVDPSAHAFVVKVQLPAGVGVRSGMFARARFKAGGRETLTVPAAAVQRRGQLWLVFVVGNSDRARMRMITAGERNEMWIEVLAGVQPGERVIVNPPASLVDGDQVSVTGEGP